MAMDDFKEILIAIISEIVLDIIAIVAGCASIIVILIVIKKLALL